FIEVDVSALELGDSLHLSDLKLAKGLEIVALMQGGDHDSQVVSVQANRAALVVEEESSDEAAAEDDGEDKAEDSE
ncbi:MAG: 50S ribosomal protein L25/general stress protein Ctc, partial [Piscirickettsiaceae bacterium]